MTSGAVTAGWSETSLTQRAFAIAAILLLALPAMGAATPIVVPPVPEQLVEGHTVFTVIEILRATQTNETRFAAAVAVLVREYSANQRAERFPGVLWFNDQYLVNPVQDTMGAPSYRYPCGGAVLAVNAGDPDPRVVIARVSVSGTTLEGDVPDPVDDETGDLSQGLPGASATYGDDTHTYGSTYSNPTPGTYTYGSNYTWIGADVGPSTVNASDPSFAGDAALWSDSGVGTLMSQLGGPPPWDYRESYLITDPNDHSWIIDKYDFYTRDRIATSGGLTSETNHPYPVWVVNMLGSPIFVPDGGDSLLENCTPFKDLLDTIVAPVTRASCGEGLATPDTTPPFTDDPCMGYEEPSRNGYCYGGQTPDPASGCTDRDLTPLRYYNALLYFKLEDLRIYDAPRDHSDPVGGLDTNGCSEETYAWGSPPDEYPCPGGDDDAEGNSHPFHPNSPPHTEREPCLPAFSGPNPTNHGGSTYVTPGDQVNEDGWYEITAPCDYLHATRNIDLYFNGAGRPFPPILRNFNVVDTEGSAAPFQDFHNAYPGTP